MVLRPLPFRVLVFATLLSGIAAQRAQWRLEAYDSAVYKRSSTSRSRILEPAAAATPAPAAGAATAKAVGENLIANGSFETVQRGNPRSWGRTLFDGKVKQRIDGKHRKQGRRSAVIESGSGADAAWHANVKVAPRTWYRLTGWIRTEDVQGGNGAQLGIDQFGRDALTSPVTGTTEWQRVAVEFQSGKHESLRVHCLLGGWGRSRGTAWFDGLQLVQIDRQSRANPVDAALFRGGRMSTTVFGRDLDPRRQYLRDAAVDVRDLGAHLAFDLRRADRAVVMKKQQIELRGFQPMWLEISYRSPQSDGSQEIHARLRPVRAPVRRAAGRVAGKAGKAAPPDLSAGGTLVVTRVVENGVVTRLHSRLRLGAEIPAGYPGLAKAEQVEADLTEEWTLVHTGEAEDSVFRARVNDAIHSGARYLRGHGLRNLHRGQLALALLTLIKAGVNPRDPFVVGLLNRLRRTKMVNTYDCAVGIMALEALYAPVNERDLLLAGRLQAPSKRTPSAEDFATIQRWTKTLLGNIDQRVDSGYLQRWNYTPGKRFDNSNSQYAMLGLYTAMLCGVEISPTVWFSAANHWLRSQSRPVGRPAALDLVSYREAAATTSRRRSRTRAASVPARGWGYSSARGLSGSMTTAGITGLVICDAALRASDKGDRKLRNSMSEAIESGFAWLDRNFSVTTNPGGNGRWHYYYLYGLERACEIRGIKLLNGRSWYVEGAELLLAQQGKNGAWDGIVDTCFAILFLKKAAPPVITGGR